MKNMLSDLNLRAENVPLLAGGVVPADQNGQCAVMNEIIAKLPETIPSSHYIPSDGCPQIGDGLHFTAEGYEMLGYRYAFENAPIIGI